MAGEIETYLKELEAFESYDSDVQKMLATVRSFAKVSKENWRRVYTPDESVTMERSCSEAVRFDPSSWPTGQQIKNAILQWHQLDRKHRRSWDELPEKYRNGLTPPRPI